MAQDSHGTVTGPSRGSHRAVSLGLHQNRFHRRLFHLINARAVQSSLTCTFRSVNSHLTHSGRQYGAVTATSQLGVSRRLWADDAASLVGRDSHTAGVSANIGRRFRRPPIAGVRTTDGGEADRAGGQDRISAPLLDRQL